MAIKLSTAIDIRNIKLNEDPANIVHKMSDQENKKQRNKFPKPDQRVRLIVPRSYLDGKTGGPKEPFASQGVLALNSGIIFPYSPTIEVSHSAEYTEANTLHSNYTQYFYKNSKVSEITLKGKFTCQNVFEAKVLLSVIHLSRALTKMRFGNDTFAGAPPPICQLMGYGAYMFDKVPVAVRSFNVSIPNDVDFITINKEENDDYGYSTVPVLTEMSFELIPMYSKKEMLDGTVDGWLASNSQRLNGYL